MSSEWSVNRLLNWADEITVLRPNTGVDEITAVELRELAEHIKTLESRLEVVSKEVEAVEALLEKATNDVSAWNSRASGAENRLHSLVSQAFESVTLGELRDWIINNVEPDRRPVAVERHVPEKVKCVRCGKDWSSLELHDCEAQ